MTLDGFLGFLALFIAFYSLLTSTSRLKAQLHLFVQVPLAILAFGLVMYFEFFEIVKQPCRLAAQLCSRLFFPTDGSFTPQQAAFLAVLCWMMLAWIVNANLKPTPRSLKTMGRLVQSLIQDRRSADLLDFVEPHLPFIVAIATRRRWTQRLHDWLLQGGKSHRAQSRTISSESGMKPKPPKAERRRVYRWLRNNIRWIAKLVPSGTRPQAEAETILRAVLRADEFRNFLVTLRPDALPDFLAIPLQPRFDFADRVLEALIEDVASRLYQELEQNHSTGGADYAISSENQLLTYLFGNTNTARTLGVWRPIADTAIQAIKSKPTYRALLNAAYRDVPKDQWRDIVYVTIRFFDLMVQRAIRQGIPDHMWLHYLPTIVSALESIHDERSDDIDSMNEFPTRGSFLIYQAFDAMGGWVGTGSPLAPDSQNMPQPEADFENSGTIPVEAASALGNAMATVTLSDRIGHHFKRQIHECVLRDIAGLSKGGPKGPLRTLLIKAILDGGHFQPDAKYIIALAELAKSEDPGLLDTVSDYVQALRVRLEAMQA